MADQDDPFDIAAAAPCIVCGTHTFMVDKVLQIHFCGWECREDYLRMDGME